MRFLRSVQIKLWSTWINKSYSVANFKLFENNTVFESPSNQFHQNKKKIIKAEVKNVWFITEKMLFHFNNMCNFYYSTVKKISNTTATHRIVAKSARGHISYFLFCYVVYRSNLLTVFNFLEKKYKSSRTFFTCHLEIRRFDSWTILYIWLFWPYFSSEWL